MGPRSCTSALPTRSAPARREMQQLPDVDGLTVRQMHLLHERSVRNDCRINGNRRHAVGHTRGKGRELTVDGVVDALLIRTNIAGEEHPVDVSTAGREVADVEIEHVVVPPLPVRRQRDDAFPVDHAVDGVPVAEVRDHDVGIERSHSRIDDRRPFCETRGPRRAVSEESRRGGREPEAGKGAVRELGAVSGERPLETRREGSGHGVADEEHTERTGAHRRTAWHDRWWRRGRGARRHRRTGMATGLRRGRARGDLRSRALRGATVARRDGDHGSEEQRE